ncbi:hypothetical protein COOONC_10559 [Cooperia oncophora]
MLPQASVVTFTNIGKKTEITNPEGRPDLTSHDTVESHETYAVIRHNTLKVTKIPDLEVNACLRRCTRFYERYQTSGLMTLLRRSVRVRQNKLLNVQNFPHSGGVRRHSPIRKLQPRSSQKKKQDTQKEQETLPSYAQDDVNFCAGFRQRPEKPH